MAIAVCKGTVIKQTISAALTVVAQVISIDVGETSVDTFETTTLDTSGASRTYAMTGYATPGDITMELFADPALTGFQAITDEITTPPSGGTVWNIVYADAGTTVWPFTVAGNSVGVQVAMEDGLKASVGLKLAAMPTFPT